MITIHHPWVFAFGLLGNIISFMVFLAPLPTFIRVYKKKSTEGFQSIPYVVAIFSAMLWIYYALLKGNSMLLITINVAGVIIETIYVAIFITYATRQARISTLKLLLFLNFGGFCSIVLFCHYLVKGEVRLQVYGWICVAFSISVFAAPLSVMRTVIRTKSVEYLPFNLSVCLTLTATIWFLYGFVQKDLYITLPNVVGFLFGVAQMVLYAIYRKHDKATEKQKLPEVVSPVKQKQEIDIPSINALPNNTEDEDIILPHEHPQKIEVLIATKDFDEEHPNMAHQDNLYGPPQGPSTCNVDAEKVIGGPPGPSSVQLVQCAV
ncbi:bidirectional sugar transporter N3-like [Amaranthus tricolor]|uniref:bidirectional sugar transporter N3-like n=1 Tax=Amaranthus tricolor TaxID=29722 RepID=UPI00258CCEA1|nr:bidirectional sugar transporter N3-like [Amaranthus tricolor]